MSNDKRASGPGKATFIVQIHEVLLSQDCGKEKYSVRVTLAQAGSKPDVKTTEVGLSDGNKIGFNGKELKFKLDYPGKAHNGIADWTTANWDTAVEVLQGTKTLGSIAFDVVEFVQKDKLGGKQNTSWNKIWKNLHGIKIPLRLSVSLQLPLAGIGASTVFFASSKAENLETKSSNELPVDAMMDTKSAFLEYQELLSSPFESTAKKEAGDIELSEISEPSHNDPADASSKSEARSVHEIREDSTTGTCKPRPPQSPSLIAGESSECTTNRKASPRQKSSVKQIDDHKVTSQEIARSIAEESKANVKEQKHEDTVNAGDSDDIAREEEIETKNFVIIEADASTDCNKSKAEYPVALRQENTEVRSKEDSHQELSATVDKTVLERNDNHNDPSSAQPEVGLSAESENTASESPTAEDVMVADQISLSKKSELESPSAIQVSEFTFNQVAHNSTKEKDQEGTTVADQISKIDLKTLYDLNTIQPTVWDDSEDVQSPVIEVPQPHVPKPKKKDKPYLGRVDTLLLDKDTPNNAVVALTKKLARVSACSQHLKLKYAGLEKALERTQNQLTTMTDKLHFTTVEAEKYKAQAQQYRKDMYQLHDKVQRISIDYEKEKAVIINLEIDNKQLATRNEALRQRVETLELQIPSKDHELEALKRKNQSTTAELKKLEATYKHYSKQTERTISLKERELSSLRLRCEGLRKEHHNEMISVKEEHQQEIKREMESQRRKMDHQHSMTLQNKIQEQMHTMQRKFESELRGKTKDIVDLRKKMKRLEKNETMTEGSGREVTRLLGQIKQQATEIATLKMQLAKMSQDQYTERKTYNRGVKAKAVQTASGEHGLASKKTTSTSEEIKFLKTACKDLQDRLVEQTQRETKCRKLHAQELAAIMQKFL